MITSMLKLGELLIFTDLDGTLLDYRTYSKQAALPALTMIEELKIPLIIVSSKTRAEIEPMLDLPCMSRIFIVENGSAVFVKKEARSAHEGLGSDTDVYRAVILGEHYEHILEELKEATRECNVRIRGFSDMSISEISQITGLDRQSAARAKQREFSEPFLFEDDPGRLQPFARKLEERGLTCIKGGRFLHALGRCDKGQALRKVLDLSSQSCPEVSWKTIALGDSPNDIPLLNAADVAVVIRRHDATYMDYPAHHDQRVIRPIAIGPAGWNEALMQILEKSSPSG